MTTGQATRAVLALGSNLGDTRETLTAAIAEVVEAPGIRLVDVSPLYRTAAVGGPADQPDFLNMVMEVETTLGPFELLTHCQHVEQLHHRTREVRWGPRTLDVDIITYGDLRLDEERLTIPHPRARERAFVLIPWAAMDPDAVLDGTAVRSLAARAPDLAGIRRADDAEPDDAYPDDVP